LGVLENKWSICQVWEVFGVLDGRSGVRSRFGVYVEKFEKFLGRKKKHENVPPTSAEFGMNPCCVRKAFHSKLPFF
jgi:hypothetical protein